MKYNRNLSSVIDSIQDEGPSLAVTEEPVPATGSVDTPAAPGSRARPSVLWIFFICLLAGMVVAGVFLLGAGGLGGYLPPALRTFAPMPAETSQAVVSRLEEFQETQARLGVRIDQLAASVADNKAILQQWLAQQAVQPGSRADRQGSSSVDQARVTAPQKSASASDKDPGKTLVAKAGAAVEQEAVKKNITVKEPVAQSAPQKAASAIVPVKADAVSARQADADKTAAARPKPIPAALVPAADLADTATEPEPEPPVKVSKAAVSEPTTSEQAGENSWVINIAYSRTQEPILKLMKQLGKAGILTEQQNVRVNGKAGYSLRITGFTTIAEARAFIKDKLDGNFGLKGPWVDRHE